MRDAVIVEAVRTPVGKRNGGLAGVHPGDLSAHVLTELAARSGIDPGLVDDVVWGVVSQVGEQALDVARTAVITAGWPEHTYPGRPSTGSAAHRSRRSTSPPPGSSPGSTTWSWRTTSSR